VTYWFSERKLYCKNTYICKKQFLIIKIILMNTEKKQWVTPTATEIEVNNGVIPVHYEGIQYHVS
jgi:hypothetical protein